MSRRVKYKTTEATKSHSTILGQRHLTRPEESHAFDVRHPPGGPKGRLDARHDASALDGPAGQPPAQAPHRAALRAELPGSGERADVDDRDGLRGPVWLPPPATGGSGDA